MLRKIGLGLIGLSGLFLLVLVTASLFADGSGKEGAKKDVAAKEEAGQKKSEEKDAPPEHWQKIDKSEEMQQKRRDFIRDLKEKDVIDHVDPSQGLLEIYIGPTWSRIKFDKKETFIDAVVTYYYAQDPQMRFAVIKDPYTDKEVGTFNQYGLDLH